VFYLIYVSHAADGLKSSDLHDILNKAHQVNANLGITGLLLYKNKRFMQLIEGQEDAVRGLYQKILQDPRHRDLVVLQEDTEPERQFPGWSMAYRNLNDSDNALPDSDKLESGEIEFADDALERHSNRATQLLHLFKEYT
jgi:hypothetical protein